jgi:uncharacterized membrane protein (UPF0127 family)
VKKLVTLGVIVFLFVPSWAGEIKKVCLQNVCIDAEVVRSDASRQQGLSGREKLSDTEGMFFVFEREERHSFWMKSMKFSLDIIWIARDGTIVDIKELLRPCDLLCESFVPSKKALYVLEVGAGFAKRHNITVGSKVRF